MNAENILVGICVMCIYAFIVVFNLLLVLNLLSCEPQAHTKTEILNKSLQTEEGRAAIAEALIEGVEDETPEQTISLRELFNAMAEVESDNNPKAYNPAEDARGIVQIRPIMVRDVNRILGETAYTVDDAYDPDKSYEMFEVFANHYWPNGPAEKIARQWNGGTGAINSEQTLIYWNKVQRKLKTK